MSHRSGLIRRFSIRTLGALVAAMTTYRLLRAAATIMALVDPSLIWTSRCRSLRSELATGQRFSGRCRNAVRARLHCQPCGGREVVKFGDSRHPCKHSIEPILQLLPFEIGPPVPSSWPPPQTGRPSVTTHPLARRTRAVAGFDVGHSGGNRRNSPSGRPACADAVNVGIRFYGLHPNAMAILCDIRGLASAFRMNPAPL